MTRMLFAGLAVAALTAGVARGAPMPAWSVAVSSWASVVADGSTVPLETTAARCAVEQPVVGRSAQPAGTYLVYAQVAVENVGDEPIAARCFVTTSPDAGAWVTVPPAWENTATRAIEPGAASLPVVDVSVVPAGAGVEIRCEQKCSSSALRATLHRLVVTPVGRVIVQTASLR